jgi:hypothetical protein
MKRPATALCLAALIAVTAAPLFAAEKEAPAPTANAPVAFAVTIAELHHAAATGDDRSVPGDRALVIDAEIGSITNRLDSDEGFVAEVELVGGRWVGEDAVELYRAYVVFDGVQFRDWFSRRSASRLLPGDKILVLCRYLGIGVDYDEETPVAVLEAFDLRRTQ